MKPFFAAVLAGQRRYRWCVRVGRSQVRQAGAHARACSQGRAGASGLRPRLHHKQLVTHKAALHVLRAGGQAGREA